MRVPANPFGDVVAKATPQPGAARMPAQYPTWFGNPIGEAVERLGRTGTAAALAGMDDTLTAQREQERQDRLGLDEAERQRVAAEKAAALNTMRAGVDELDAAHDVLTNELLTGRIDKTKAAEEWTTRAADLVGKTVQRVPQAFGGEVKAALEDRLRNHSRSVAKAVTQRDQQDTRAGLLAYLGAQERLATSNLPTALRAAEAAIDGLGPYAGMNPAEIESTKMRFTESATFAVAASLVRHSTGSAKELDAAAAALASDRFAGLDPQRREQLEARIDGARARLAAEEAQRVARAEAAAAKRLRVATAAFEGVRDLIDRGAVPDDMTMATATAATVGTPYAPALRDLVRQGAERATFAQMKPEQQQAALLALRTAANAQGSSPEAEKRIDELERIARKSAEQLKADPLVWAHDRRLIPSLRRMDVASLETFPALVAERLDAARAVSAHVGKDVSPLLKAEAEGLAQMLRDMPVDRKAAAVQTIATAIPDRGMVRALAEQMNDKDRPLFVAMSLASKQTSAGRSVAELVLRGAEVIATKANKGGDEKEQRAQATIRGAMVQEIGDAYFAPALRELHVDAATLVQAALRAEGDRDADERAVRLATGGIVTNRGGYKVAKPYGWSDSDFHDWLTSAGRNLRAEAGPFLAGGAQLTGEQVARALPNSRLAAIGEGQYVIVGAGGQIVRRANGAPVILDAEQ